MKKVNVNYPHPVLSAANEDYIDCSFDISLTDDPVIEGDVAIIDVSYELVCAGLLQLVEEEKARVLLYMESVESEYRSKEFFNPHELQKRLTINKNLLSKSLQVRGYVVAAADIHSFKLPEQNTELFGGMPYDIRRGDILAISENFYNIPIDSYDPLADRPSIFAIRRQTDHPQDEVWVDLAYHKITIFLNNDVYEKYEKLHEAPEMRMFLASLFAAPVLVDVLSYIKNADEDAIISISDKKWYQVISAKLTELGLDLSNEPSMTKVANIVLPHIFKANIEQLADVFNNVAPTQGGDGQ